MKGENLVGARTFIMVEMAGYPPYYIEGPEECDSGWGLYRGHYVAPAQDDLKVHLGIDGGTGVVYFEDVGVKEVPDVCENNDFEENYVEPEDTIGFVGWTYEPNGGAVELEPLPQMNHAAAQLLRASDGGVRSAIGSVRNVLGGGFDDDPIGNTILKQRINCLPRTEYEVTIFAKHNITAKNDYHGAFAVVGNITGSMQIDAITVYTGDFVEVFNLEVGSSDWTAYTARFTSSEDWFEITLGLGATAVGSASFDAVLIRDLTTRRYEYIYGLGWKLATLEYEGNVPEGQVYFDHHDVLASPVMRTDIDGDVVWKGDYAPFGETLEEQPVTWGSQYRFLGNEDDGGLMDFGARFYDPRVGRFVNADPIRDVASSRTVNPYVYCANNPLRYTDKFGLRMARGPIYKGGDEPSAGGGGGMSSGHYKWGDSYHLGGGLWGEVIGWAPVRWTGGWVNGAIVGIRIAQDNALDTLITKALGHVADWARDLSKVGSVGEAVENKNVALIVPVRDGELYAPDMTPAEVLEESTKLVGGLTEAGHDVDIFEYDIDNPDADNFLEAQISASEKAYDDVYMIAHGGFVLPGEFEGEACMLPVLGFEATGAWINGYYLLTWFGGKMKTAGVVHICSCNQSQAVWNSVGGAVGRNTGYNINVRVMAPGGGLSTREIMGNIRRRYDL
jgi:RHS repeat-associated protein